MSLRIATIFGCAAVAVCPWAASVVCAEGEEAPAAAAEENSNPELEGELRYVEALINYGYPDFAEPIIEATKQKWPDAEAKFFAIEIRGMLSLGKFDEAEAKIAALPDRDSPKYWAARLEVANNLFFRGKKAECSKIYDQFFSRFPKPTAAIRDFYLNACYAWGQILVGDKRFEEAVRVYSELLGNINKNKSEEDGNTWCNVACETSEMYIKLATDNKGGGRSGYLDSAKKIVDQLLWEQDRPVYFGRAIAMKANIELLRGDIKKAQHTIDEYMEQLAQIHQAIVEFDPDGKEGLRRQSPMPMCRFMLAKMLWGQVGAEMKKPKPDKELMASLLFGEKKKNGKRDGGGAYNHALNVFVQYPECTWAADAGTLVEKIENFVAKEFNKPVKKQITPEQMAKVREMQFAGALQKINEGDTESGIKEYFDALSRYPEGKESIRAIEKVADAYLDLILNDPENPKVADWRIDADAVEGYLAERFAMNRNKEIMTMAGDAVLRLAATEKQRKEIDRANALYHDFLINYRKHIGAPTLAASMLGEAMREERYKEAIKYCKLIQNVFSNSMYYVSSFSQESFCYGKLEDREKAMTSMEKYVKLEKDGFAKEQARMALAQMFQKEGFDLVNTAEDKETPEEVEAALKAGNAKIIHGIKEFQTFAEKADKAMADPGLSKGEKSRYSLMKEQALYLIADCWRRLTKPEAKLEAFRKKAAEGFEKYLEAYPEGAFSTNSYVRLGTIYTALGDTDKAREALNTLSQKFPDSLEAKNAKPQLAKSLIEMGMRKEGTAIYAEMLRTKGNYTAGQFLNAGEALIDARSWDLAHQAFEMAISLAPSNQYYTVAKARIGEAKALFKQKSYVEAREAIDLFLADDKMSKMTMAADAYLLMVEVASEQGSTEQDPVMRAKHFGAAIGANKRVRNYWKSKPQWEQDKVDLMSAEIVIRRLKAEEKMNLKDAAEETRAKGASMLQAFIQSHGVDEKHPFDKMEDGEKGNLERAYEMLLPLLAKLGKERAEFVVRYGNEYNELFPEGKLHQEVINYINQAKAEGGDIPAEAEEKSDVVDVEDIVPEEEPEEEEASEAKSEEAPAKEDAPAAEEESEEAPAEEASAEEAPAEEAPAEESETKEESEGENE